MSLIFVTYMKNKIFLLFYSFCLVFASCAQNKKSEPVIINSVPSNEKTTGTIVHRSENLEVTRYTDSLGEESYISKESVTVNNKLPRAKGPVSDFAKVMNKEEVQGLDSLLRNYFFKTKK